MPSWTTATQPPSRQFEYWREVICAAFLDLSAESAVRGGFLGRVDQRACGPFSLARIDSQAQLVRRTEEQLRQTAAGYYANFQVRGVCVVSQDGRTATTHPGDLAVVDTSRPFTMAFSRDFRQLSFHVPAALPEELRDRTAVRVPTVAGVGASVRHIFGAVEAGATSDRAAARLAAHAQGLLALALDGQSTVVGRADRGLVAAALADIEEHFADDDLAPASTAGRLGISVRLLHQLFAGREHSFVAEVRRRRLEQARRDLLDPTRSARRVIDIATDAGFVNVAHFHRVFRAEFGRTPAQVRTDGGRPGVDRIPR